ncbi:retrovirus-related pol polyprotein from transposon TNT 1-94, partial [Tanacetum coccineum]
MDEVDIEDLTIVQYLRLTQESQAPKKIEDMTIAEYLEYEKKVNENHISNTKSYLPTYFIKSTSTYDPIQEFAHYFGLNQPGAESDYDSKDMEEEVEYMIDDEVVMSEQEESNHGYTQNIQHLEEKDDVDKWLNTEITKHMSMQGVENMKDALISIIKSIRQEMKDDIMKRKFEALTASVSDEVSSIASNEVDKADDNTSNTAPYAKDNIMPQRVYEYLGLDKLRGTSTLENTTGTNEPLGTINILVKFRELEVPGRSFICITDREDEALPLGRVNGARFKAMIRKELEGNNESDFGASDYDNPDPAPELQNVSPSADTTVFFLTPDNSVPQDTQPSTNIQPTSEPSTPTNTHAEENTDDQAEFTNPFCTPAMDQKLPINSSSGNPSMPVQTRRHLATILKCYVRTHRGIDFDENLLLQLLQLEACQDPLAHMLHTVLFPISIWTRITLILNGPLKEEVYVAQPDRFVDPDHPDKFKPSKGKPNGSKQAPRAWYDELSNFLMSKGFTKGLQIHECPRGIFINQAKYALEILKKMEKCDTVGTPMATKPKLDADFSGKLVNQSDYHSKIRSLMYLTSSRPDIVQAVCYYARYQVRPTEKHLKEVKRIFRYLRRTNNMGLWFPKDSGFELTTFSDTDHVRCIDTRKSTSGGIQFLGDKLVSWMSKKQDCTAMSSVEAEYVALSASCAQVMWMRTQLKDYGFNYNKIPLYCNSQS